MRNALLELRRHPARLVAVLLAITISVAFVVASLVFTATESHAIGASITAQTSASDVVVELSESPKPTLLDRIGHAPGVASVEASYSAYVDFGSADGAGQLMLYSLPTSPRLRWASLSAGVWPAGPRDLVIDLSTAKQYRLAVGHEVTLAGDGTGPGPSMRISGITDQSRSLFAGVSSTAFVTPSYFTNRPDPVVPGQYLVLTEPSASPTAVVAEIRKLVPADSTVQTSEQLTADVLKQLTHGADVFRYLLLVFGAIALLVGAIIITNTFTIVLAQRRRQIGLLRAVGASTAQVRRGVLTEAVLVGSAGSVLGVALGIGISAVATAITGSLSQGLVIDPSVLGAVALGLVTTVLAAVVPASRAMRVAPLEALRPVADEVTSRRATVRLRNVSLLVIAVGALLVIVALRAPAANLVLAIGASVVLTVGILMAAPTFLPAALRTVGRLTRRAGPVARLAGANSVRNPGRAAATCTALMLGVGLIVTLQVGSASIKSTFDDTLDQQFPVDLIVRNPGGALSPDVITGVRHVPGLTAVAPVTMTTAEVRQGGSEPQELQVAGLGPDARKVVAAGFDQLNDGVVLAHASTLKRLGARSGERLALTHDQRLVDVVAVASDIAPADTVVLTEPALARLDPVARVGAVWGAAADRGQAKEIMADVRKASARQPGLEVTGSVEQSASLDTVLDSLLAIATGLLAVSVLIALIGVGNTLGLSVIERTRESALLRALGLQRRELRLMLAVEAAMLALVGAVVGIAAGAMFGVIGTAAVVKQTGLGRLHVSMAAGQTLAVVAIAVLAGVLASVIPGRRAALAAPTQALAEV